MVPSKSNCHSSCSWCIGCVTKDAEQCIEKIGIKIRTEVIQKTALLGTARILRKVLET